MDVGKRIRELRIIADMSQGELGERVGVQRAAIHKYEKGSVTNIPIQTIERIAKVFDVSPTYLVGWDCNGGNPLAAEVKIIQGVRKFYGEGAVELLETFSQLDKTGKKKVCQYAEDMFKIHGQQDM